MFIERYPIKLLNKESVSKLLQKCSVYISYKVDTNCLGTFFMCAYYYSEINSSWKQAMTGLDLYFLVWLCEWQRYKDEDTCTCTTSQQECINLDYNSFKILILVGFVLVSGGTVLHIYSTAITSGRHARSSSGPGVSSPINAMFAGMFLETIFLVSQ